MALTKTTEVDKIEVVGTHKMVQVRTATIVSEDGVELSRSYHRHVVSPLDDASGETAEVQAICTAMHTQAVRDAYQAHLDAQASELGD